MVKITFKREEIGRSGERKVLQGLYIPKIFLKFIPITNTVIFQFGGGEGGIVYVTSITKGQPRKTEN